MNRFEYVRKSEIQSVCAKYAIAEESVLFRLHRRATAKAAGYDFFAPFDFSISAGEQFLVPSFVKVRLRPNLALFLYPRSSLGIKKGIVLANTVGIIDADYYGNKDNDGHIIFALKNTGKETVEFRAGDRFAQGIIQRCFFVDGDDFSGETREGGFGSTGE